MKKRLFFLFFILSLATLWSQNVQRIEIKGIMLSENQDVEGVTVFNRSSNKGTITNSKGEFVIGVSLNDRIEVSALQFNAISFIIDEDVIKSKSIKVYLVEQVNQLDAVILSSGLSGNIALDIDNVKTIPIVELNMGNMNMAFEYHDDRAFDNQEIANAYNTTVNKGQFYNGFNPGELFKLFSKPKSRTTNNNKVQPEPKPKGLLDVYSHEYISKTFDVPLERVNAFIAFLEAKGIDAPMLNKDKEMQLIEYVLEQRQLFLDHGKQE